MLLEKQLRAVGLAFVVLCGYLLTYYIIYIRACKHIVGLTL